VIERLRERFSWLQHLELEQYIAQRVPQDISPGDNMRLRTAMALLVCPPVAPAAETGEGKHEGDTLG
jgi:ABC-type dipeptide/oligopeptide/nickel transport system ATPase subunit